MNDGFFGQPVGTIATPEPTEAPVKRRRVSRKPVEAPVAEAPAKRRGRPARAEVPAETAPAAPAKRGRKPGGAAVSNKLTAVHLLSSTEGLKATDRDLFGKIVGALEAAPKGTRQRIAVALKELFA